MTKYVYGVDVGGTTIKAGLFEISGKLIEKWKFKTRKEAGGQYILSDIATSIQINMKEKDLSENDVIGIGLGVPGPVLQDGMVMGCVNLGWKVFNVEEALKELTSLDVKADNDAKLAALGEMWQGGAKGYVDVVMVTLGTGIGGGIIINGKLLTGAHGSAGEIGHIKVMENETEVCSCGDKGCLEQYASATGLVKEAAKMISDTESETSLKDFDCLTSEIIFDLARQGDRVALDLVDNLGQKLGLTLANISCICDPQVFIIGGGVSEAGHLLIHAIEKHYRRYAFHTMKQTKFKLAELGNDAGIFGGAKLLL